MKSSDFLSMLERELSVAYYAGVPDSLLGPLIGELTERYGISSMHTITANEGNAAASAAGYHLATGKIPCVYMQNSGQGNMLNPYASLLSPKVYKIPCVFVVGWRGEPGVKDEPQHVFQGEITGELLDVLKIESVVISKDTDVEALRQTCSKFQQILADGKCVAFIIQKGALTSDLNCTFKNTYTLKREDAIEAIARAASKDVVVCTTGKASRELYEIRERSGQSHQSDFLTVGSMGHSASIALEVARNHKEKTVWCIDGDGALLMHMGSMAVIGAIAPSNYIHVLINNEAHETVGGMPTVAGSVDFLKIAEGCGYKYMARVDSLEGLQNALVSAKRSEKLSFIEVKAALGARSDLGRPTTTAEENKRQFMAYLQENTK